MKVLFLSLNNSWKYHFETELELMLKHLKKGDDVYILTCNKRLKTCVSNQNHFSSICFKCRSRFSLGVKIIGVNSKNIFFLNRKLSRETLRFIPKYFDNIKELKEFKFFGVNFGLSVVSSIISEEREQNCNTIKLKNKIFNLLYSSLLVYESFNEAITKVCPDLVYIFNGRRVESFPAVALCKQLGIDFYTHERGSSFKKYSLFKNDIPHSLSLIHNDIEEHWFNSSVGDKEKEEISEKWFCDRAHGKDQDWYSFTINQEKRLLPKYFSYSKKNIALFNSSADEVAAIQGWNRFLYDSEEDAVLKIVQEFQSKDDYHFYLRIHPNLKNINNTQINALKKIEKLGFKNLTIIWPEDLVDTYHLLLSCEKSIALMCTTVGIESCFWGKPTILLGNSAYEKLDSCYIPKDHCHLVSLIKSDLELKNKLGAFKYGYWSTVKGIGFKYFKPKNLFDGEFLGKKVEVKLNLKNKVIINLLNRLDNFKRRFLNE